MLRKKPRVFYCVGTLYMSKLEAISTGYKLRRSKKAKSFINKMIEHKALKVLVFSKITINKYGEVKRQEWLGNLNKRIK